MKSYDIAICVYEGGPAVAIQTGETGIRYGLCADCKTFHDRQLVAAPHIATMEDFRTQMRAIGQTTPTVEKFIDDMVLLLTVTDDPQRCMNTILATLGGTDEKHLHAVTAGATS